MEKTTTLSRASTGLRIEDLINYKLI